MSAKHGGWFTGLILLLVLGCTQANKLQDEAVNTPMTLWQLITALEQQMPISAAKIEAVMGISLVETERYSSFVLMAAKGPMLADGLAVTTLTLRLRNTMVFDEKSSFGMELTGTCILRDEISRRYGDLRLVQYPRGRSPEETAIWAIQRPWGDLSFAFKQDRPDCLFAVSFSKAWW